jgi:hypothetical protein
LHHRHLSWDHLSCCWAEGVDVHRRLVRELQQKVANNFADRQPRQSFDPVPLTVWIEDKGAGRIVDPGDQIGVNLSSILAVNSETSLSFGIELSFFGETDIDGQKVAGSNGLSGILELGVGTILTPSTLLSITAGMGFTEAAPDFRLAVSMPVRF